MNIDVVSDSIVLRGYRTKETVKNKIATVSGNITDFRSGTTSPLLNYIRVDMWGTMFNLIRNDSVENCCDDYLNAIVVNRRYSPIPNLFVYRLFTERVLKVCYSEKVIDKQRTLATVSLIVDKDVTNLIEPVFTTIHNSTTDVQWTKNTDNPKLLSMIKGWLNKEYAYQINPLMNTELIEQFLEPNDMQTIQV